MFLGDRVVSLLKTIKETIDEEKSIVMKIFFIYRAIITMLIALPLLYVVGFILGVLMIHNPHEVGKELISIMY